MMTGWRWFWILEGCGSSEKNVTDTGVGGGNTRVSSLLYKAVVQAFIHPGWASTTGWTLGWYFKVQEGITKSRLNKFSDGRNDLLTLQNRLCEIPQQDQIYGTQQDVDFWIFSSQCWMHERMYINLILFRIWCFHGILVPCLYYKLLRLNLLITWSMLSSLRMLIKSKMSYKLKQPPTSLKI